MKNLLCLLFVLPLFLSAQIDTSGQHRMIKGLVDYRHELIARNPEGFKKLYLLDTLWKIPEKEAITDMMTAVTYANKFLGMTAQDFAELGQMYALDTFEYRQLFSIDVVQSIIDNDDLALMLGEGILKQKPPFTINPESTLFEELAFYKVENGMAVAEIGTGTGMFSLMLGLAYDSLTIYMNNIEINSVNFTYDRVNRCRSIRGSNKYYAVQGKKKSTALEAFKLDKVIIRNSFHHFSHKDKMLSSIKESISPGGDLYIFEPDKVAGKTGLCPLTLPIEALRKTLVENGFVIIEEKRMEELDWVLMHCKPIAGK